MSVKIVLGSDKSGFPLKEAIKSHLTANGFEVLEIGTVVPETGVPFFKVAPEAAKLVQSGECKFGILICGTGMGMSQASNKYKGIRAACVESVYAARMCRAINDSNILCMGGWVVGPEMGLEMTTTFLSTAHLEGLEPWRQEFLTKAASEFEKLENEIFG